MKMQSLNDFSEQHGLNQNHMYVAKNTGKLPEHIFDTTKNRHTLVDGSWIIRRAKFKNEVLQENTDIYYRLHDKYSHAQMARMIIDYTGEYSQGWASWLSQGMWRTVMDKSVLSYKITKKHWQFYRALRRVS